MTILLLTTLALSADAAAPDAEPPEPGEEATAPVAETAPIPEGLEFHVWAEGGMQDEVVDDKSDLSFVLPMARLQARFRHDDGTGVFIQVGADGGTPALLDAVARGATASGWAMTAGRFKVPLSAHYLTPVFALRTPRRSPLMSVIPRRSVGLMGTAPVGPASLDLGVFDADGRLDATTPGALAVGRLASEPVEGLSLHAAAAAWLHEEAAEDGPTHDRWVDLAAGWERGGWTAEVEGLLVRGIEAGWDPGVTALVARRWEAGAIALEPALGWDTLWTAGVPSHRGTVALGMPLEGWHLLPSVAWESEFGEGEVAHAGYVLFQAGW